MKPELRGRAGVELPVAAHEVHAPLRRGEELDRAARGELQPEPGRVVLHLELVVECGDVRQEPAVGLEVAEEGVEAAILRAGGRGLAQHEVAAATTVGPHARRVIAPALAEYTRRAPGDPGEDDAGRCVRVAVLPPAAVGPARQTGARREHEVGAAAIRHPHARVVVAPGLAEHAGRRPRDQRDARRGVGLADSASPGRRGAGDLWTVIREGEGAVAPVRHPHACRVEPPCASRVRSWPRLSGSPRRRRSRRPPHTTTASLPRRRTRSRARPGAWPAVASWALASMGPDRGNGEQDNRPRACRFHLSSPPPARRTAYRFVPQERRPRIPRRATPPATSQRRRAGRPGVEPIRTARPERLTASSRTG